MKILKQTIILVLLTLLFFILGCNGENETVQKEIPQVTGEFEFSVLKAGQADAIIMRTQNHSVIIDMGEKDDGDEVVEYLKSCGITNLDYVFITHFDKDHVGGFPEVMNNVTASNIFVADYEGNNDEYEDYLKTVENKKLDVNPLKEDISFVLDDVLLEVSVPKKNYYKEGDNDYSLVISVTHGKNTFLFAGDAEEDRLPEVTSEFGNQYDFLKVPHHGKYNKNSKRFINTIKPKYAVVTDSDKNPTEKEISSLLESAKTTVYSTRNGDVSVVSDGKEIIITQ